jgi:proteasome lid subunit RPN8/RPN11
LEQEVSLSRKTPIFGEEEQSPLLVEPSTQIAKDPSAVEPGSFQVFFVRSAFESAANYAYNDDDEVAGILFGWVFADEQGAPYAVVSNSIELRSREKTPVHFAVSADEVRNGFMRMTAITGLSLMVLGWYHSQPGWGVHLSQGDHGDEFTTKFIFNLPWQIALVFDPLNKENAIYYGPDSRPLQKWSFLEVAPVEVEMASRYARLNDLISINSYEDALVETWILGQRFSDEYANGELTQWGNGYRNFADIVHSLCNSFGASGGQIGPDNPYVEAVLANIQKILPIAEVQRVKSAITYLPEETLIDTFQKAREQVKQRERKDKRTTSIQHGDLQAKTEQIIHTSGNDIPVPDRRKTKLYESMVRQADLARRNEVNWDVVRRLAHALLELDPENAEADTVLAEATSQLTLPKRKSRRV